MKRPALRNMAPFVPEDEQKTDDSSVIYKYKHPVSNSQKRSYFKKHFVVQ